MSSLNDVNYSKKNVLLICPLFYEYHTIIHENLLKKGANVTFIENKQFPGLPKSSNNIIDALQRITSRRKLLAYQNNILNDIVTLKFDYIIVICGFSITPHFMSRIRQSNKNALCILYLWDSFDVWDYSNLLPSFDRVLSFDRLDTQRYSQMIYLPLFHSVESTNVNLKPTQIKYDLLYTASVNFATRVRLEVLEYVSRYMEKHSLAYFIWLYQAESKRHILGRMFYYLRGIAFTKYINKLKKLIKKNIGIKDSFLSFEEINDLMDQSNVILDISLPAQSGMTMRTIEALAAGKKLLTSNEFIKREHFYNENVIMVLPCKDEERLRLFLTKREYDHIDMSSLHVKNWLDKLICQE